MWKTMVSVLIVAVWLAACTYNPSGRPIPNVPAGQLDATMTALKNLAASQSKSPSNSTGLLATASISGKLSFPAVTIPAMRVIAFDMRNGAYYTGVVSSSGFYQIIHLPAGAYHVVAYPITKTGTSDLIGGYSQAVLCGLSGNCTDHSLISVRVTQGAQVTGINPDDFNAPAGAFPPDPSH
jgi:hypothetical protein